MSDGHIVTFKVSNGLAVVCTCGWEKWASWPKRCSPEWAMQVTDDHRRAASEETQDDETGDSE